MKDKIEIGEYVRTKKGNIGKFKFYGVDDEDERAVYFKGNFSTICVDENEIVKHSKNLINLIEKGDFVNGYRIIELIRLNSETISICVYKNKESMICSTLKEKDIKTILTHEIYKNNCYEMEG